ncbi:YheC/YheD family endospore coat-associated protein [Alicyclobacillus suci]|uniref:YheC/YheD family endospore coat-associated protein n=1 Tax=Alicyclobacillus suci TaxID=2816080 RepID=UPI001A8CD42E|nr:YheC/YheD family protein [Alicyclobacillus suci]
MTEKPRIGYLHLRRDPEKVRKLYAFQAVAKMEGALLFYFSPRRIDLASKTVQGLVYENGRYRARTMPFPDVVYNDRTPQDGVGAKLVEAMLETVPVTSHSVGNKLTVYRRILSGKVFADYLIPSRRVVDGRDVIDYADQHGKIVVKPVSGRQGKGIFYIRRQAPNRQAARYRVIESGVTKFYTASELTSVMNLRLRTTDYLMQPFIVSQTKDGATYDFRIHVQKDKTGDWTLTAVYPRMASANSVIPNLSSGGYTMFPELFFQREFGARSSAMFAELADFGIGLARHLERVSGQSYDELGIDVGIDERRRLWLYEVNWRPGPPPIWNIELDVVRNAVGYAMYLAGVRQRARR